MKIIDVAIQFFMEAMLLLGVHYVSENVVFLRFSSRGFVKGLDASPRRTQPGR